MNMKSSTSDEPSLRGPGNQLMSLRQEKAGHARNKQSSTPSTLGAASSRNCSKNTDGFHTINLYLEEIRLHPLLTAEEEIHLCRLCRQGDEKSKKLLIESNLRLVVKIARDYYNCGLVFLDVVKAGNLGLIRAVEKFDPERSCRFSTYVSWWVRQAIERAVLENGYTIGAGRRLQPPTNAECRARSC